MPNISINLCFTLSSNASMRVILYLIPVSETVFIQPKGSVRAMVCRTLFNYNNSTLVLGVHEKLKCLL